MPRFSNRIFKKRKYFGIKKCDVKDGPSEHKTPRPSTENQSVKKEESASKKSLSNSDYSIFTDNAERLSCYGNEIIDLNLLSNVLENNTVCKQCLTGLTGSMRITKLGCQKGLATKLALICTERDYEVCFFNSERFSTDVVVKGNLYLT